MSSLPPSCSCCLRCRADSAKTVVRKLVPPRRSIRIREQAWHKFYHASLNQLDKYKHLRDVDVKVYETTVVKHLLDMAERPDKEERKILIRIVFEFLCKNTHIVINYLKFRDCVLNKINELNRDLANEPESINNKPIEDACNMLYNIIERHS